MQVDRKERTSTGRFAEGNSGRKKGSENKVTKATREAFQALVDENWDDLNGSLAMVRAKDHKAFIELVLKMAEFCVPKLKAIEHNIKEDQLLHITREVIGGKE